MSPWERRLLTLLLATTYRPTELPLEVLLATLQDERKRVREFWSEKHPNRLYLTHTMIECVREREPPAESLLRGWWVPFLDYLDESWSLYHPRFHRPLPLTKVFLDFKRSYDLDTNRH